MTTAALALYLVFLVVATAGRMALHKRRTGDWGLRADAIRGPTVARVAFLLLWLMMALTFVAVARAAGGEADVVPLGGAMGGAAALLLSAAGMLLTVLAQHHMGASWRFGVDLEESSDLVQAGVFAHIRNPIYTGVIVFGVGLMVLIPNALMIAGAAVGLLGLELLVRRVEEPHLLRHHGDAYVEYASRVGRFVPGLGRLLRQAV